MSYKILFSKQAEKTFLSLDRSIQRRVADTISDLGETPHPPGSVKLEGEDDLYRMRVGDWRIVYTVKNRELIVLVLRIGHRGDIYRKL
jgi:mRNA interferase RelE/StbE